MRIVALLLLLLLVTPPARAGGWAVTYVDPVAAVEPGRAHTVGYWVLQHGTHPYEGDLGTTGLKFDDGAGEPVLFKGVRLHETAHYAVSFSLPAGKYRVLGVQGWFADHEVGTLTVPGTLEIRPVDRGEMMPWPDAAKTWSDIKPPLPAGLALADPVPQPAASVTPVTPEPSERPIWVIAGVLVALGGAFWLTRRLRKA